MKYIVCMMVVLLHFSTAELTSDFITGFETGVYVRDDERAFKDYSCPKPEANDAFGKQIQGLITPMKLMGQMMNEPRVM